MGGQPVALSTMYFQRWADRDNLAPFLELAHRLGFPSIELSHILAPVAVDSFDATRAVVAAVHHPCPYDPADAEAGDSLVSASQEARQRARLRLRRSVDTAARLGAPAVVVHLGKCDDDHLSTSARLRFELQSRFAAGQTGSEAYHHAVLQLGSRVRDREPEHIDRAARALPEAVEYAADKGVTLALETGYHPHELPTFDGMARLLDAVPGLGAWLDTGHVGAQANLGLTRFDHWFDAVGDRWTGVHCHDVVGLRDHLAPGAGELHFEDILRRLAGSVIVTLEVDWYLTESEIVDGRRHVQQAMDRAWGPASRSL